MHPSLCRVNLFVAVENCAMERTSDIRRMPLEYSRFLSLNSKSLDSFRILDFPTLLINDFIALHFASVHIALYSFRRDDFSAI